MIEQQLRDGLRAAVTAEPPLGFDPDDLVTRTSGTAHRRRTTFAAVAAAAIVVAGTVGAVAATGGFDRASRTPVADTGDITATTPEGMVRQVGESFAARLPEVHPGATNVKVRVDPAPERYVGMVRYDVGEKHFALAYAFGQCVPPTSEVQACPPGGEVEFGPTPDSPIEIQTATVTRDDVGLQLATADHIEALDYHTHFFTSGDDCECPKVGWASVPKASMRALITDSGIDLPAPSALPPSIGTGLLTAEEADQLEREEKVKFELEREQSDAERKARQELDRQQAQLEKEAEELKRKERESAEPGGK